jgi:hypothetical protein
MRGDRSALAQVEADPGPGWVEFGGAARVASRACRYYLRAGVRALWRDAAAVRGVTAHAVRLYYVPLWATHLRAAHLRSTRLAMAHDADIVFAALVRFVQTEGLEDALTAVAAHGTPRASLAYVLDCCLEGDFTPPIGTAITRLREVLCRENRWA